MFKKTPSPKITRSSDESFETIIGPSTEIHGQIHTSHSLRIDGRVVGDIHATEVSGICIALGLSGSVHGNIHAHRVIIGGRIDGNIFVSDAAELHDSARVNGDITYEQISIESGAKINGRMITKTDTQQAQSAVEPAMTLISGTLNQALPAPASG
jgi:cytoskeletal protein CcmA (bactofilin family)